MRIGQGLRQLMHLKCICPVLRLVWQVSTKCGQLTRLHVLQNGCPLLVQPVQLHGSLGREAATGRGTVFAIRELLKHSNAGTIANKTYVIQVLH